MPTFQTAYTPATGQKLSAGLLNTWIENNQYLFALASRTFDTFQGVHFTPNTNTVTGLVLFWSGWFRYAGDNTLLCAITRTSGRLYINLTDNNGTSIIFNSNSTSPASTISLAAYSLTVGTNYLIQCYLDREGGSADVQIDYIAIQTANAYTFPTLVTWAESSTPTSANFGTINTAQNYLRALAETPNMGSMIVYFDGQSVNTNFYNGAFYYRRGGANVITITYMFPDYGATLTTYAIGGAAIQTWNLGTNWNRTERTDTFALDPTGYTDNTFYRIAISSNTANAATYVKRITVGGTVQLANNAIEYTQGATIHGDASPPYELYWIGNEQLTEIKNQVRGATATGFQFLTPAQSGTIRYDDNTRIAYALGAETLSNANVALDRTGDIVTMLHVFRYLYYRPVNAGDSGSIKFGATNAALADNASGGWSYIDLEGIAGLNYGMTMYIQGVSACYEAVS